MDFDLNLLAKIVSGNMGASVVKGSGFSIRKDKRDGLLINLPTLKAGNDEDADMIRGGLCHEAVGHGKHTDFDAQRGPTKLHLAIENVIEDARIERAAWSVYKKSRRMLERLMEILFNRDRIKRVSNQNSPAEKAATAFLLRLMCEDLGYCAKLIDWKEDWKQVVDIFGEPLMDKAYALCLKGSRTGSTTEVIVYAAEVVKLLQEQNEDEPKDDEDDTDPGEQNSSGGSGEEDGDTGDGEGDGTDSNDVSEPGDKPGKAKSKKSDESTGDDSGSSSGGSTEQGEKPGASGGQEPSRSREKVDLGNITPEQFDRGNMVSAELQSLTENYLHDINVYVMPPGKPFTPSPTAKVASQRLKSGLVQRLQSVVEDEDDEITDRGSLASNMIVGASMGERYSFTEPGKPGEDLNTAIDVLCDMSDSMNWNGKANACLAATWAMGDVLSSYERLGLSFSVESYNSGLYVLKDWNKPWFRGAGLSHYQASGGTRTEAAVYSRLQVLIKRREKRKILFLITDEDIGNLEPQVNSAKLADIELVVLMVDVKNITLPTYIKKCRLIKPEEVAPAMMTTVKNLF